MPYKLKILKKFFSKTFTDEDLKNLFFWFNSEQGQSEIIGELDEKWSSTVLDENIKVDSQKIFNNVKGEISKGKIIQFKNTVKRILPYAAILVIAIVATFFVVSIKNTSNIIYTNTYTSFVTENGQRSKVVLPDSSIVWLNSGTTLSYLYNKEKKRSIILNGQAFFQVRKDKNNPFTVNANGVDVKVLGTRFGVEAYSGEGETSVVLESGSVELTYGQSNKNIKQLVPGELAVFNIKTNSLEVNKTDLEKYISWKDNKLIFKDEPMKNVIADLERWYNIEVEVADNEVYNSIFNATITTENYQQIFRLIEYSCPVQCEINENYKIDKCPLITIVKK